MGAVNRYNVDHVSNHMFNLFFIVLGWSIGLFRKSESIVLIQTSVGHVPSLGFHLIQYDRAEMAALMSALFPLTNDQWQE